MEVPIMNLSRLRVWLLFLECVVAILGIVIPLIKEIEDAQKAKVLQAPEQPATPSDQA